MNNRNLRDTERRNYIKKTTKENLKTVIDDPESLFFVDPPEENIKI